MTKQKWTVLQGSIPLLQFSGKLPNKNAEWRRQSVRAFNLDGLDLVTALEVVGEAFTGLMTDAYASHGEYDVEVEGWEPVSWEGIQDVVRGALETQERLRVVRHSTAVRNLEEIRRDFPELLSE